MKPAVPLLELSMPRNRPLIKKTLLALLAVVLVSGRALHAQSGAGAPPSASKPIQPDLVPRPTMHATRATGEITVDAKLDEADWARAESVTDFIQQLPNTGEPAKYRSVVRILYDDRNIYIAAINYDPEPRRAITVGLERDFVSTNSDVFGVVFDTFHDHRNSFLFLVNPMGAVRDEQTFNDSRNIVEAWDGVSVVKTAFQDSSWTVEMAIPLRTLRFDASTDPQSWGINFIRRVRRVNESSYWAPLERQYRLHRMSRAGTLEGLSGLKQGRNLQIKPYVLARNSDGAQVPASTTGASADAGADLKYGLTPSLTLDLTYNTDFSQTEVDQQVVNLTRFGILFPERREFFIENLGSFTFGDVTERNYRMGASLSDFTLFNSRQIGLTPDGLPIPIVGGARVSGRAAGFELGLLDMQTKSTNTTPAENFGVVRVRRNLFGNSDIGMLVSNREATDTSGYNRSYGVDANIRLFTNLIVNSYVAATDADGRDEDGNAGRVSVAYRDRFWNTSAMYKRISENFRPGIGFVRRRGFQQTYGTLGVHARPSLRGIQEANPYVEVDYIADPSGPLQTRDFEAGLNTLFQPDGELKIALADRFDRLDAPFTVAAGRTIKAGSYSFRDVTASYVSFQSRKVYGTAGVTTGSYYDGTRTTLNGSVTFRPRYDMSLEATYQHNALSLASGDANADVSGLRLRYAKSTTLFGSAFAQYNTQTRSFVTNARIDWRWAPLSDVYLVYTDRQNTFLNVKNERSIALKITRMVAF